MKSTYYQLPLRLADFISDGASGRFKRCSLLESIDQHIELLLMTCPGEHSFNSEYGTLIWELDFERIYSQSVWVERFATFINDAIEKYEKRIYNVQVKVVIKEIEKEDDIFDSVSVRKRVDISVIAVLCETNEQCGFKYQLYLGPLSNA